MKKICLSILAVSILIASCKKEDETNDESVNDSRMELLTSTSWMQTKIHINGEDVTDLEDDCVMDDIITFNTDGSLITDEGASKCDTSDPQATIVQWEFINNENGFRVTDGSESIDFDLVSLSVSLMVTEGRYTEDSTDYTVRQEFTAQ